MISTKTKVSPKIAMGVLLVVIGVAFGAVGFNALVPTILTPISDTTAIAAVKMNPATGWTYVYGDTKKTATDLANLAQAIADGYDVKIVFDISGDINYINIVQVNCNGLSSVKRPNNPSGDIVSCNGYQSRKMGDGGNYMEYWYLVNAGSSISEVKYFYNMSNFPTLPLTDTKITGTVDKPIKWFIKR